VAIFGTSLVRMIILIGCDATFRRLEDHVLDRSIFDLLLSMYSPPLEYMSSFKETRNENMTWFQIIFRKKKRTSRVFL
jgi:hypothetical protein